ncbi:methyltransferase family protein [Nocardioides sp. SYSU DS0651]|uniref:methyltransferase family protein n=1 Tax=Nocardioides sp. SYSU DS0651 TaxID=3415955 RepID=UPI003F4BDBCB
MTGGGAAPFPEGLLAHRLPLLGRMAADLRRYGALRRSTAAWMYAAYVAHVAATVAAARRPSTLPVPDPVARRAGWLAMASGAALWAAGVRRFDGAAAVSGTADQPLLTTGIYAYSRNPQYVGYVAVHGGLAVACRSGLALGLTGVLAATYRAWVPVEEQHLSRTVGAPYAAYRRRTHRWWGRAGSARS